VVAQSGVPSWCPAEPDHQGQSREGASGNAPQTLHETSGKDSRASPRPVPAKGLFALVQGIADTALLVAFVSSNDRYHDWAVSLVEDQTEPLLTCESVLSETAFHLRSSGNPHLADLCLIRMSELYPHHKVITTDCEDFSAYWRNKRDFIPLVCPRRRIEAWRASAEGLIAA